MKIEAVFSEISQDFRDKICIFGPENNCIQLLWSKNSNKNISNLFKANIMKIMYECMVTECGICSKHSVGGQV